MTKKFLTCELKKDHFVFFSLRVFYFEQSEEFFFILAKIFQLRLKSTNWVFDTLALSSDWNLALRQNPIKVHNSFTDSFSLSSSFLYNLLLTKKIFWCEIWTLDLWCRRRSLCRLSHNHYPLMRISFLSTVNLVIITSLNKI